MSECVPVDEDKTPEVPDVITPTSGENYAEILRLKRQLQILGKGLARCEVYLALLSDNMDENDEDE